MNSEVFFDNIKAKIREELFKSRNSVYLAVAWLTDDQLFTDLVQLSSKGIGIKIIMNDDEINRTSGLDFSALYQNGGLVYFVDSLKNLMHNKFCIIDEIVTINGSFNWTRKANNNLENITIIREEKVSKLFLEQFNKLINNTFQSSEYLNLENTETLELQLEKNLSYEELISRAEKRRVNESYLMAIHDYRNAIKIIDNDKSVLFDLAYCQSAVGDNKAAIENYSEYLNHFPKSATAFNNRGNAYDKLKELNKAIEDYSLAISIEDDIIYYENRATSFASFLPDNGTIYAEQKNVSRERFSYSRIEFLKKQGNNAILDYQTIFKKFKDIDRIEYYKKIAEICYTIRNDEMAIEYFSRVIANTKENHYCYYSRAWSYFLIDDWEKALYDINKAISYSPSDGSYKNLLELIKKEKRKPKNWFKPNNVW